MVTGAAPFQEMTNEHTLAFQMRRGKVPTIPDRLSEQGKEMLNACFQLRPLDRPSAEELLMDRFCTFRQDGSRIATT